jgi:hypothetical protein
MSYFFAPSSPARRIGRFCARFAAILAVASLAASAARAEDRNPFNIVTDAIGLTAPTAERPDFVRESRPDEQKMDFVPFTGPDKKRIPVKTADQTAADDAALLAEHGKAQVRLKKLQTEAVETLPAATKPPALTDKF